MIHSICLATKGLASHDVIYSPSGIPPSQFFMVKHLSKPKLALLGTLLAGSFLAVGAAFTNTTSSCAGGRFKCCNNLPRCGPNQEREKRNTQIGDGFWTRCKTKCACNKVERKQEKQLTPEERKRRKKKLDKINKQMKKPFKK